MNFAKNSKVVNFPIANIKLDFSRNFARENTVQSYEDPNLRQDLATRGQITPILLLEVGTTPSGDPIAEPMQGNRRSYNLAILANQGVEDPTTCKVDDKGVPIAGTGKPFTFAKAILFKGLTERERVEIMADHGNVRGLTKAELQLFIEGLLNAQMTEKDACRLAGGLLLNHYPPKREIKAFDEDKGADFLANYKGVIDAAKRRWKAPKLLHDQAMEVLRGKQNWPTKAEIYEGLKIHEQEVSEDRTGKLDRETPGPKFMEWYNKLLAAKVVNVEAGEKPKSISMFNRAQAEELAKLCDSRLGKYFIYVILRDDRVFADKLPVVAKLAKKAERMEAWTTDDVAAFDECWNANPTPIVEEVAAAE